MNWILIILVYLYLGFCSGTAAINITSNNIEIRHAPRLLFTLLHMIIWPLFVVLSLPITIFELIYRKYE